MRKQRLRPHPARTKSARRREHVLVYCEATSPGGTSAIIALTARCLQRTWDVTVAYSGNPSLQAWAQDLRSGGITVLPAALRNLGDVTGWLDLPGMIRLLPHIRRASIVHCHSHAPFSCLAFLFLATRGCHRRVMVTEHGLGAIRFLRRRKLSTPLRVMRSIKLRVLLHLKGRALARVDRIVTVCDDHRRILAEYFGAALQDKAMTIHSGIDPRPYRTARSAHARPAGVPRGRLTVTTIAALNNAKGLTYLVQAFPDVVRHHPRARLFLVGEGHIRKDLEREIHVLGMQRQISLTGHRDDVPALLAASDVVVLPSLYEGSPLSLLEAMAAAKPVIATEVGGIPEIVVHGKTGILIPPRDPQALAAALVDLLGSTARRRRLGERGKARLLAGFTGPIMCAAYQEAYTVLASTGLDGPPPAQRGDGR